MSDSPARPITAVPETHEPDDRRMLFVDGVRWTVREFTSRYDRRSRPDLVFESDAVVRRVRNYPANWRELASEALFALSLTR